MLLVVINNLYNSIDYFCSLLRDANLKRFLRPKETSSPFVGRFSGYCSTDFLKSKKLDGCLR